MLQNIPDDIKPAVDNRANQIINGKTEEDVKGLNDLQNLHLAIGLPFIRKLLTRLMERKTYTFSDHKRIEEMIFDISPITEASCFSVSFVDKNTNKRHTAYLLLDECDANHNLEEQFDKFKPRVTEEEWTKVLRKLSEMIGIGRTVYAKTVQQNMQLIRMILGVGENDNCAQYLMLKVDPSNTTMFVDELAPKRIGIFIKLDSEV